MVGRSRLSSTGSGGGISSDIGGRLRVGSSIAAVRPGLEVISCL
jgi:hypothetical protein